tara:strand:+ start:16363 stop:17088 length:726 start_codon:yes stop_codon:yes gene_type:complete
MKKLLVVGDVHTDLKGLLSLAKEFLGQVEAILQVGDMELYQSSCAIEQEKGYLQHLKKEKRAYRLKEALKGKKLEKFPIPVYFIKGNHEDFENLDSEVLKALNIHYIKQGDILNIGGRVVAGIGGIHSPVRKLKKTYELEGSEKRFYTLDEISKLLSNPKSKGIEILLTHQAPAGVIPEDTPGKRSSWEEGTKDFEKLLNLPKLRYAIHGHHHINYEANKDSIKCIGLGNFSKNKKSYCII